MCTTPRSPDRGRRGRAGFTLMEVLVTLTITGILATVIFQVVQGNSEFVRMQSAREEVQQNARAAVSLISSDLRAVAPGGIVKMSADSITFLVPRAFGVLCNTLTGDSTVAWTVFPADGFPADFAYGSPGWGVAVEQTLVPTQPTGAWQHVRQVGQSTGGASRCDALLPSPTASHLRLGFTAAQKAFVPTLAAVLAGTSVQVFEEVRYDVAPSTSAATPGTWIRRSSGYSGGVPNMQPMAGPVPATGALRFTYTAADGITPALTPADVRRIRIQVIAESRAKRVQQGKQAAFQLDTATTEVFVRN